MNTSRILPMTEAIDTSSEVAGVDAGTEVEEAVAGHAPSSSRTARLLRLFVLSSLLTGAPAMAESFQPIARLACPDGDFIIDGRPHAENEAGGSAVELRYRYKGIELAQLSYEGRFASLAPYLRQNDPPIHDLGLRLDTGGQGGHGGEYERGPTLYLPPATFSGAETGRLADCIARHRADLRHALENTVIASSAFLGLMKTRAKANIDGIARIVHAAAPIAGLYESGWFCVLIEPGGRVLLHTTYTGNAASESVPWGRVEPRPDGRPVLRASQRVVFAGKEREGEHHRQATSHRGRRLSDDYTVVLE